MSEKVKAPITSYLQLTPGVTRRLRNQLGMSQSAFWGELGISLQRGNSFETRKTASSNHLFQLAVFVRYVMGVPLADGIQLLELSRHAKFGRAAADVINQAVNLGENVCHAE